MLIRYAHLASPQGESFQGFWVMDHTNQPIHSLPFATKRDAQVFAGTIKTWGDVAQFVDAHALPFKVIRFNMSNRGVLVDSACEFNGDDCAHDVYTAREVVLTAAYEMGKLPVPQPKG